MGTIIRVLSLCLIALPVAADEIQIELTGDAVSSVQPGQASAPFDVNFTLNTLSGTQDYSFAGGCLNNFSLLGGSVSNFSASVGGHGVWSAPAAIGIGGGVLGGACGGPLFDGVGVGSGSNFLLWNFDSSSPTSLNPHDPLAGLLTGFEYSDSVGELSGGWQMSNFNVRITPRSVPEPGSLGLMVLGLALVMTLSRRRVLQGVARA